MTWRNGVWNRATVLWEWVSSSLWFVPGVMVLGSVGLAIGMIELSDAVDREALRQYPRLFGAGADSSRDMLSTIAMAMMTVAGVTFSITMVAVTQASRQYTPRILHQFMRDRPNQFALGTFTGTFAYCLVVIRTVRADEEIRFIPELAVIVAFGLALVGVGVLIFFIDHMARSLQPASIVARVRDDTLAAVDKVFANDTDESDPAGDPEAAAGRSWTTMESNRTGYITTIDTEALVEWAEQHDTLIRMERGIGEYVIAGTPLVSVADGKPTNGDTRPLIEAFDVGLSATVHWDPAYGVAQMVSIAADALTGEGSASTAVTSIDAIAAVLAHLANRTPKATVRSKKGSVRLIVRGPTFESLLAIGMDDVRQAADGNVSVLRRLLHTLEVLAARTRSADRRSLILAHAARVLAAAERNVPDPDDLAGLRQAYERVRQAARL